MSMLTKVGDRCSRSLYTAAGARKLSGAGVAMVNVQKLRKADRPQSARAPLTRYSLTELTLTRLRSTCRASKHVPPTRLSKSTRRRAHQHLCSARGLSALLYYRQVYALTYRSQPVLCDVVVQLRALHWLITV